jgi:phage portal protein, HK97 family
MGILNKIFGSVKNESSGTISMSDINSWFFNNHDGEYTPDISEITYFVCMKKLSESLGKMPVHLKDMDKNRILDHETYSILNVQPNPIMTPAQFFTYMEFCRNHNGNGYAFISRDIYGNITGLYPLDPRMVQIWVNNTEQFTSRHYYYFYTDSQTGKTYWFAPEDVLHVKSWVTERSGLAGKSVREILHSYMKGSKASQKFLTNLYEKGLTANAVVKYVGDLDKGKEKELIKKMTEFAGKNTDRIIPLPLGFDLQTLDLKLTDSQFYELKKFSGLQIASAFGVMPNHLNNYEKSSYANSSMQNLTFYVDTLLYNVTLYEQEMKRKLLTSKQQQQGLGFEFNVSMILRGDPVQQAEMINKYVTGSVYTVNEGRRNAGLPPEPDGDVILANGSYVKLADVGNAYKGTQEPMKGGE